MKVPLTDQPCAGWDINLMLPKVVKQNGAHELFMNTSSSSSSSSVNGIIIQILTRQGVLLKG